MLADDDGLTGWVDFEHECFEDPLIGLPKFRADSSPTPMTGLGRAIADA
ncbi:hypothetical protein ABZV93_17625 [Actinopolymorpha sp. NPDC004070]